MNATEAIIISINLDDLLLARDVMQYQKEYFRMISEAKRSGKPEKYEEAKRHLSDCKSLEKRLTEILASHVQK